MKKKFWNHMRLIDNQSQSVRKNNCEKWYDKVCDVSPVFFFFRWSLKSYPMTLYVLRCNYANICLFWFCFVFVFLGLDCQGSYSNRLGPQAMPVNGSPFSLLTSNYAARPPKWKCSIFIKWKDPLKSHWPQ